MIFLHVIFFPIWFISQMIRNPPHYPHIYYILFTWCVHICNDVKWIRVDTAAVPTLPHIVYHLRQWKLLNCLWYEVVSSVYSLVFLISTLERGETSPRQNHNISCTSFLQDESLRSVPRPQEVNDSHFIQNMGRRLGRLFYLTRNWSYSWDWYQIYTQFQKYWHPSWK